MDEDDAVEEAEAGVGKFETAKSQEVY